MKKFAWNTDKNEQLKAERNISFEQIMVCIAAGDLLDTVAHPNPKFRHQQIYVVQVDDYVWLIPFVESDDEIFLKTIIPSRKATKKYLRK